MGRSSLEGGGGEGGKEEEEEEEEEAGTIVAAEPDPSVVKMKKERRYYVFGENLQLLSLGQTKYGSYIFAGGAVCQITQSRLRNQLSFSSPPYEPRITCF
jgi:hypothetical protein